jgi:hypothetical protein
MLLVGLVLISPKKLLNKLPETRRVEQSKLNLFWCLAVKSQLQRKWKRLDTSVLRGQSQIREK